ncbi:Putative uncharacterized protein [Lactococcus lactis subsp. lactis A12]|uniref:Uncharacterized protein n=1 Tax=Lactococcus lactis subsp. lactis A12 TaxID=1137134 RepID=S6FVQ5_LACLL|nr:Putative uncharacterized protein [Lactococcus lactis subsp. lactis A12]
MNDAAVWVPVPVPAMFYWG